MRLQTRIAPTPSGYLHIGNAWSFVITTLVARTLGASIQLRIDDMDRARFREEYLDDIFDSLKWLGIHWDSGPQTAVEFHNKFSQQKRHHLYNTALKQLSEIKNPDRNLIYGCRCSRKDIKAARTVLGLSGNIYPGTCRNKKVPLNTENINWRIRTEDISPITINDHLTKKEVQLQETTGDFSIRTKKGEPAYQLCSVVDDEYYGNNLIVRGSDLLDSSAAQLFISPFLDNSLFSNTKFLHHSLITDVSGNKLSKSNQAPAIRNLRSELSTPNKLFQ
ncbi:MAG: tRNA glutamyl-Q synthetase, partial [Fibrobacteria bacterium]|nr:tRNA glutamyl-Q synthetase [Fibrobacteria bacterium]